jgi:hypothetical protein
MYTRKYGNAMKLPNSVTQLVRALQRNRKDASLIHARGSA